MKRKYGRYSFVCISGVVITMLLSGCGQTADRGSRVQKENSGRHEPLTIIDSGQDYTEFMDLVHERYPEIQIQVEGYLGQNQSRYFFRQLESDDMPDIYTTTYNWDGELQKKYLLDLSGEEFSGNYNEVYLDACSVDGENYLLPGDYSIQGIVYNKTLFEKHGWKVPGSFKELKKLLVEIKASEVQPSITMLGLPGYGFQFFCNVSDTIFLTTKNGKEWIQKFLGGTADARSGLDECAQYFQQWIDCGMLNGNNDTLAINECRNKFYEGNTAFLIGSMDRLTQNEDGSGDQYGIMPYLSPDGTENMYITSVRRYYGLNKHLEDAGNEQKLEDALHFMEVLSTEEGEKALNGTDNRTLSSLKDNTVSDDSPYKEAIQEIQMGHGAPLLYAGWEAIVADGGTAAADWICGYKTGEEVLDIFDKLQSDYLQKGPISFGTAKDTLDTEQCAELTGIMFGEACDADAALISVNEWKEGVDASWENFFGANGKLFRGKITEDDLVVFLPTGWYDTIHTAELTGKEIKELKENGYNLYSDDISYPYILCTKNGEKLKDDQTYKTVICGEPEELQDAGRIDDTGIVGLEAAEKYLQEKGEISADQLEWK